MKELILDLRDVDEDIVGTWADSIARFDIENTLLNYAGKIIRVKITETASSVLLSKKLKPKE